MARQFQRSARQEKDWLTIPGFNLGLVSESTFIGGSLPFTTSSTILRMLGEYVIGLNGPAPTAQDGAFITVGIGVVSSDAFAAGGGSMPDPNAEGGYPWLYWRSHPMFFRTTTEDPSDGRGSIRVTFDVKSMRKVKASQSLVPVIQYADVSGLPALRIDFGATRVLVGGQ